MDAFLVSTGMVALGEIGDKTQLLAIMLAARYHRPGLICLGVLIATLANHALAGLAGQLAAQLLDPVVLQWVLGISFLLMAGWLLIPDKLDETPKPMRGLGVLTATITLFFLAEMGDKTQLATVALGAKFHNVWAVTAGTTLGMMLANVPAVFLGNALLRRVPLRLVHGIAAVLFIAAGILMLGETSGWF